MVGLARHRDRRRDAHEHQDRRHQEAAAYAEQARDESDRRPQRHQERRVDRHLGDGQVDVHDGSGVEALREGTPVHLPALSASGQRSASRPAPSFAAAWTASAARSAFLTSSAGRVGSQRVGGGFGLLVAGAGGDEIPFVGLDRVVLDPIALLVEAGEVVLAVDHAEQRRLAEPAGRLDQVLRPAHAFEIVGARLCMARLSPAVGRARSVQRRAEAVSLPRPPSPYNLWVRPTDGAAAFPLTSDGVEHFGYAAAPGESLDAVSELRRHDPDPPIVVWSPDSRYLLTHRIDERQVNNLQLLQSVPEDGSLRPKVYSYRFSMPGDAQVPQLEPFVFDVTTHSQVELSASPVTGAFISLISNRYTWWSQDSRRINYLDRDRFSKWVTLNVADPVSGKVRELVRETSDTWVRMGDGGVQNNPAVRTLSNGDVLWYSERDGHGHLYYYDGRTGALRNQITRGPWVVRAIIRVDETSHRLYFMASGREPGRDPYERRLYRVNFDGSALLLLTPEEAEHDVHFHEGFMDAPIDLLLTEAEEDGFSASGRYFVDTYSRPDAPPTLLLRTAAGKLVRQLEVADISALRAGGYTPVEPFSALAADGNTPLYGNILRPSSSIPGKPIPSSIPFTRDRRWAGRRRPSPRLRSTILSERKVSPSFGFVVITVDGRGTPHRSKAFMDASYGDLGSAGNLEDHIAVLHQLAKRYPYIDLNHVGIWGASGGGYAAAHAILQYPDFYKVAVSADGNHDQLGYVSHWGETYSGPVGSADYTASSSEPLAARLKGKLLLIHGEMDDNVHPFLTLRLADSLIKANKDFDLLLIPNAGHRIYRSPYVLRRKWDYFVRYLMGAEPPANYTIGTATPAAAIPIDK